MKAPSNAIDGDPQPPKENAKNAFILICYLIWKLWLKKGTLIGILLKGFG